MLHRLQGKQAVLICLIIAPQFGAALSRFQSWFPRYANALNYAVANNCSDEYAVWQDDSIKHPDEPAYLAVWSDGSKADPLVNCILSATPELIKASFSSAAVLLGLMPGLLALLGPGIQETSTLLALGDRPLLALLICLGSPLVGLQREVQVRSAFRSLRHESIDFGLKRSAWLTCVEYILVLGAMANIGEMTYELAYKVQYSWFQGDAFVLGIWIFVGFVIHLLGTLALSTSISLNRGSESVQTFPLLRTFRWLRWRFSFAERNGPVQVVNQPPSYVYFALVAFIMVLVTAQIVFGTMIFSGILFIGVLDAVGVFFRYMASVVVCRVLVLVELALLRPTVEMKYAELMDDKNTKIDKSTPARNGDALIHS